MQSVIRYLIKIESEEVEVKIVMHVFSETECNWSERSHCNQTYVLFASFTPILNAQYCTFYTIHTDIQCTLHSTVLFTSFTETLNALHSAVLFTLFTDTLNAVLYFLHHSQRHSMHSAVLFTSFTETLNAQYIALYDCPMSPGQVELWPSYL